MAAAEALDGIDSAVEVEDVVMTRRRVQPVDILRDEPAACEPTLLERRQRVVRRIGPSARKVLPANKRPRPVALALLFAVDKFHVLDGLVPARIRPTRRTVIWYAGSRADPSTGHQ